MPIKGDQRTAFNDALKTVTKTNKELVVLYQESLDNITKDLAVFKLQIDQGKLSNTAVLKQAKLKKLQEQITNELDKLYFAQGNIVTSGWTQNYTDTYYQIGFALEKEVNNVTLPAQGATFDYSVNYQQVNSAFAKSQLNTIVGGFTFTDRQAIDKALMQGKVRAIINNAIIDGLTPVQVANELQKIDDIYASNRARAITTARTELLRAYSIAAEESAQIAADRGIEGKKVWDATLDGKTRPAHARADQQKADENGMFRVGGELTLGPRMPGLSAGNSINCRCRAVYLPEGVKTNTRGSRLANGDWKQVNGDLTWQEWAKTLDGKQSIEKTRLDKIDLAKRAKKKKDSKKS